MAFRPLLAVLLAVVLLGAACGAQEEEQPAAPPAPPAEPEPPEEPLDEPPEEPVEEAPPEPEPEPDQEGPEPVAVWGIDEPESEDYPRDHDDAYLTDVRVSQHEAGDDHPAFDRVVLEFEQGTGPSWRLSWEEAPVVEDPSGRELDVQGEAFLRVSMHPATGVDLTEDEPRETYDGPESIAVDGQLVREVVLVTDHHRALAFVLGLEREAPFAVALLQGPPRLVIDVVDE